MKNNYNVIGCYYKKKKFKKIKNVKYIFCDVRKINGLRIILNKYNPNIIFHLAAKSHPFYSFVDPIGTINTNVIGTINLLETCRALNINPKIIMACSSGQYGSRPYSKLPMKENESYDPEHIYGLSKVFQDSLCKQYFKMFKLKTIRAILFNTSGQEKNLMFFMIFVINFKNNFRKIKSLLNVEI